jgi:hypothetical protein
MSHGAERALRALHVLADFGRLRAAAAAADAALAAAAACRAREAAIRRCEDGAAAIADVVARPMPNPALLAALHGAQRQQLQALRVVAEDERRSTRREGEARNAVVAAHQRVRGLARALASARALRHRKHQEADARAAEALVLQSRGWR